MRRHTLSRGFLLVCANVGIGLLASLNPSLANPVGAEVTLRDVCTLPVSAMAEPAQEEECGCTPEENSACLVAEAAAAVACAAARLAPSPATIAACAIAIAAVAVACACHFEECDEDGGGTEDPGGGGEDDCPSGHWSSQGYCCDDWGHTQLPGGGFVEYCIVNGG